MNFQTFFYFLFHPKCEKIYLYNKVSTTQTVSSLVGPFFYSLLRGSSIDLLRFVFIKLGEKRTVISPRSGKLSLKSQVRLKVGE